MQMRFINRSASCFDLKPLTFPPFHSTDMSFIKVSFSIELTTPHHVPAYPVQEYNYKVYIFIHLNNNCYYHYEKGGNLMIMSISIIIYSN